VPVAPLLALLIAAVVVNLGLMGLVLAPTLRGRPSPFLANDADHEPPAPASSLLGTRILDGLLTGSDDTAVDGVPTAAYDRVVRIVSFVFVLSASAIVAVTGLWSSTQPAILALLVLAGLFVLTINDILPPNLLGTARFVAEGSVAITFATVLVALTGQESSPFFFVFPLIVAGAALVVNAPVTVGLATASTIGYLAAVGVRPDGRALETPAIAVIGINLTALVLLAYVATVIAREQRRSRDAAIRLSTVDSLTGLFNRAFFFAALEREIQRSARSGRGFCLLMMDLDGLKSINDKHGHFHGDEALRSVGDTIRAGVRRIDTASRYGGDEFVVLLPETDPTGAFVLAEKIRQGVADRALGGPGFELRTSLSIGVVSYPHDGTSVDELMISADQAMYISKRQGKNRVAGYRRPADPVPVMDPDTPADAGKPADAGTPVGAAVASGPSPARRRRRPAADQSSGEPVGVMATTEDEPDSV
jgi:diguanylate cyclase (GGDEF)-like protein